MGVAAVATVFAPGLVPTPDTCVDPMDLMAWTDRGVRLTSLLLRLHQRAPLKASAEVAAAEDDSPAALATADAAANAAAALPPPPPAPPSGAPPARTRAATRLSATQMAARMAAQSKHYVVERPHAASSPGDARAPPIGQVRKRCMSVEDRAAGLEALLAEIELSPSQPTAEVVVAKGRQSSADV